LIILLILPRLQKNSTPSRIGEDLLWNVGYNIIAKHSTPKNIYFKS
jgi:hypothetical protein